MTITLHNYSCTKVDPPSIRCYTPVQSVWLPAGIRNICPCDGIERNIKKAEVRCRHKLITLADAVEDRQRVRRLPVTTSD